MKRIALIALAAAAGIAGLASCEAEKPSLTVVSWGGAYTKSQIEAYHKPFTATNGTRIDSVDYTGDIASVKAQVESGNVSYDIVDMEVADAIRACDEGMLEQLDLTKLPPGDNGTPAAQDFEAGALDPCYVATIIFSHIIAYDRTKFSAERPMNAADFFDTARFPGKRGLRKTNPKINFELALLADGVPPGEVYSVLATPAGIDRAFAKLDSIKDSILWWNAGAEPPKLLAEGQVVMTTAYNGRIFDAIVGEGKPFEIIWANQLLDMDVWGIVKGTKKKDLAFEFLKFSTDTKRLADQARWIAYSPARKSSLAIMQDPNFKHMEKGVQMLPYMPTAPQNYGNALPLNHRWWADHQDELTERWSAWLAK